MYPGGPVRQIGIVVRTGPQVWESIPGLLERFTNTDSGFIGWRNRFRLRHCASKRGSEPMVMMNSWSLIVGGLNRLLLKDIRNRQWSSRNLNKLAYNLVTYVPPLGFHDFCFACFLHWGGSSERHPCWYRACVICIVVIFSLQIVKKL